MPDRAQSRAATLLAACAIFCAGALALALLLQHSFEMQPCAWCVLQRGFFLLAGIACALGAWVLRSRAGRAAGALGGGAFALVGLGVAIYQQLVAAQSDSCDLTLADRIVMSLSLHEIAPSMFLATASCAEANLPMLGIPFALWSAAGFVLVLVGTGLALRELTRAPN